MRRTNVLCGFLAVLLTSAGPARAGGPLLIFSPATRTPYAYNAGTVNVYTDLGNMGPTLTNAEADALVASGYASWTGVASAFLAAAVAGDFASIGLPDITHTNAGLVIGANNGGGIHVVYDNSGLIFTNFFGAPPGVLGIASPDIAIGATIMESWAVLNGTQVNPMDPVGAHFAGVFTHEFGHTINLAHTQTNGARIFFGDATGPASCSLPYGGAPTLAQIETMCPFIDPTPGSVGDDMATVEQLDDVAALSNIYPTGGYPGNRATIRGTIYLSDGVTQVTGVNVIARNLANPFGNCISALSGDYTQGDLGPDGLYTFNGLTSGADYVVYIDGIVAGGFSTPPVGVSANAEEFHNGASESGDPLVDDRCLATTLTPVLGPGLTANVIVNEPYVLLDDDGFVEVDLPFTFPFCDVAYSSVFIGANGFLTFGAGDADYTQTVAEFLAGAPRISALWCDLSPQLGTVTAQQVGANFVIQFIDVPLFSTSNSNNFTFTLRPNGTYSIVYGQVDVGTAIAGRTPGGGAANPGETNLSSASQPIGGSTVYENFTTNDFDLDNLTLEFATCGNPCIANEPPIAVCQNVGVSGDTVGCEVNVTPAEVNNGSSDPDGTINSMTLVPTGPYGEGMTSVQLIVTDNCGASDTCSATITVTCPVGPIKEVTPASIMFPGQTAGDTTCGLVTIRNIGDQNLVISSVTGCDAGDFFLDASATADTLAPADSTTFLVCYSTIGAGNDTCTITISTNNGACDVVVSVGTTVGIPGDPGQGRGLILAAVAPNPFTRAAEIRFSLPEASRVDLDVYDLKGRRVRSILRREDRPAGENHVLWDGNNDRGSPTAVGIYFIRLLTEQGSRSVRAIRTR